MTTQLITDILNGKYDSDLEHIARHKAVRNNKARIIACSSKTGDKFEILKISPQYLIGQKGIIRCIRQTRAEVDMDQPNGRFGEVLARPK